MSSRMTREELLRKIFKDYDIREKNGELRLTRVRVPGCELSLAHVIGVTTKEVYQTLSLHIGVHEGEDHTGESLGFLKFTPWEAVVIAADIAIKAAHVDIGFMDRFSGALILTGEREEVYTAVQEVVRFFKEDLHFPVCRITES